MISGRRLYSLRLPSGRVLKLGDRTLVMGILNVTPDSFADGGVYLDPERALAGALHLESDGADIIDIGGESTRPGATPLTAKEELNRLLPVVTRLVSNVSVPISVDTYKAEVARCVLDNGVSIVNDISSLGYDSGLARVVAEADVPIVLMHNRGQSSDM